MADKRFTTRSAAYLILKRGNEILLSRRFNTGWMDGSYSLVAGHLDENESIFDTITREAYEETGITVAKDALIPAHVLHRKSPDQAYIDFFFVCTSWQSEPTIREPNKCDDLSWFTLTNLPTNTLPFIKAAAERYEAGIAFSEYGWE